MTTTSVNIKLKQLLDSIHCLRKNVKYLLSGNLWWVFFSFLTFHRLNNELINQKKLSTDQPIKKIIVTCSPTDNDSTIFASNQALVISSSVQQSGTDEMHTNVLVRNKTKSNVCEREKEGGTWCW